MRNKFFFGAVIFFLFSLFVVYFGVIRPRFVGLILKSNGVVAVNHVERSNLPVDIVRVVGQNVVVDVDDAV